MRNKLIELLISQIKSERNITELEAAEIMADEILKLIPQLSSPNSGKQNERDLHAEITALQYSNSMMYELGKERADTALQFFMLGANACGNKEKPEQVVVETLRSVMKEAHDLMEHCVDRKYIDPEDESIEGVQTFNAAMKKGWEILSQLK